MVVPEIVPWMKIKVMVVASQPSILQVRIHSVARIPFINSTSQIILFCTKTVEASTLNERSYRLRPQDIFLRDNISREDTLIVSVGGNDVAMMPTPCTILSMAGLLALPMSCIRGGVSCCTLPVNDCCCGCGPSTCSCLGSFPPCLGYFRHLFGIR